MTIVMRTGDGGRFFGPEAPSHLQCLTGANEAQSLLRMLQNISKHGFGFFPGEGFATAFSSLLFMGKLPAR